MSETKFQLCLILLFSVILVPSLHAATPQIISMTGRVKTGSIITINGSNIVNEDKTNWIPWFKTTYPNASGFEGADPHDDGYCKIRGTGVCDIIYDKEVKLMGNQSCLFHKICTCKPTCGQVGCQIGKSDAISVGTYNDIYIRTYARWYTSDLYWPTNHIKFLYCMANNYYFSPAQAPHGTTNYPTKMNGVFFVQGQGNTSHYVDIPSGRLQPNRWYYFELHWKSTDPRVFDVWMDGDKILEFTPRDGKSGNLGLLLFGLVNYGFVPSGHQIWNWFDGLVMSTSRVFPASTIEVGNSGTYGRGSEKWQEPVYLSDGSVQVKLDLTELGNGPYYLWVTNNRQERSRPYLLQTRGAPHPRAVR